MMSMHSIRTTLRILMAYGVALAVASLTFGASWPEVVRWAGVIGGATVSLLGAAALRGLGPENETPFDWLDESEWPSPEPRRAPSVFGTTVGWLTVLLAGVGTAISLAFAVLYFQGKHLSAHPTPAQGRDAAMSMIAALIFGLSLPFVMLRPRYPR